jgi:hypothetical protein
MRRRAAVLLGVVAAAAGVFFVGAYVVEAIRVLDEPDRSWFFWGVPFLFGGILLVKFGVRSIVWGRARSG